MNYINRDYKHRLKERRRDPKDADLSYHAGTVGILFAALVTLILALILWLPSLVQAQSSDPWGIGMTPYGEVLGQDGGGSVLLSPQDSDYGGYGAYGGASPYRGGYFRPVEPYYAPPRSDQDPRNFHPDDGAVRLR